MTDVSTGLRRRRPDRVRIAGPLVLRWRLAVCCGMIALAFAVRVAYVESTSYHAHYDADTYLRLASEIAHSGDYGSGASAPGSYGPTAYFPPAFPYYIAVADVLDGHTLYRATAIPDTRIAQAVLGTATVALVGLVAAEAFDVQVAGVAMILAAVYPPFIALSGSLASENLLVVFELAAVWAALRHRRSRRRFVWAVLSGMLAGLAALSHENGLVLLIPLVVAVWSERPRLSRRALLPPLALVASAIVVIAPWTIRNAVVMHSFIPISDETGVTLVGTYNQESASDRHEPYAWSLWTVIPADRPLRSSHPTLTEPALNSKFEGQAFGYIADHPFSVVTASFNNLRRLFELAGAWAWKRSATIVGIGEGFARVGILSFWALCILAMLGVRTWRARNAPRWLWLVPVALVLSVIPVNAETPRFREGVDPFIILLAAAAVVALIGKVPEAVKRLSIRSRA